jgi:hypothetical protein
LLRGVVEVRTGGPIGVHDALGEEIGDRLLGRRPVRAKDIVEGMVLPDDHDDVLDRRAWPALGLLVRDRGSEWRKREDH